MVQDAGIVERRKARGLAETPCEVTPPTPAAVVRVLVEVGSEVVKGQGLVVVSAMKMEMTLVAPYSGTVRAVNTQVGAGVSPRRDPRRDRCPPGRVTVNGARLIHRRVRRERGDKKMFYAKSYKPSANLDAQ